MPGVMIYMEDMEMFYDVLTDAEIGAVMKAVKEYVKSNKEPEGLTPAAILCFRITKAKIDRDNEKYRARSENGKRGGRPESEPKADETEEKANATESKANETEPKANESYGPLTSNSYPVTSNLNQVTGNEVPDGKPSGENVQRAREERFARFWAAYPKKVGKGAAEKAFAKYKPDDVLTDRMIRAVTSAKASIQWQREGGQFIPNPATWLNQRRWEDEIPDSSTRMKSIFDDA